MKKVLLILCAVAMFSFDSAQKPESSLNEEVLSGCPSYSTEVSWDCGSTCLTTHIRMTGDLYLDAHGGIFVKPTLSEMIDFANDQNDRCD